MNAALDYVAAATGVGAIGAIALLILGTQILNWYWPVALFLAGLAVGAWKLRGRALSRYSVAQMLDRRLGLSDRLSTLVWFRDRSSAEPEALETVARQASERVHELDVERAVPVTVPRHAYASAALILSAFGLFGVRYFVLQTMDLSAPLARIDFSAFAPEPRVQAATRKSAIQERFEKQLQELGLDVDDMQSPDGEPLQPIAAEVPGASEPGAPKSETKGQKPGESPEEGESAEGGDEQQEGAASEGEEQQGKSAKEGKQGNPPPNAKQGEQGGRDSLMNKMKDALANLMNKMKNQGAEQQQQMAMNQQQQPGRQGQQNQQGMQSKAQGQGQQNQDQQGDRDQQGDKASGDQSKAGEKSDKPGSESSKTGMGQSEGEKAIKDAEQLAAMGKISEILGKRAQQITGEMTVEVASGKQQLKTAWTERKALHADTGGEVNRDEIPLAHQAYIQRYFEEVRKSAAKPATPKSGS